MATFLYYGDFASYAFCENWIAQALNRNGHHCVRMQRLPEATAAEVQVDAIVRTIERFHADYLLISKAPELDAPTLREIKRRSEVRIVMWTFDWMRHPSNWAWYGPQAKAADICFQTDGYGEQAGYDLAGIRRVELHQGCLPELHKMLHAYPPIKDGPKADAALSSDLVFIGSIYTKRRMDLMERLHERPGFLRLGEPGVQAWGRDFAAAVGLSKVVVGDNFVNDVAGYWSDRVYLTLGCGGFFLTAYVPGLELEFENHRHLVWYSDFDEMDRLLDYYLPRESARRAIALEGHRLVHRDHTYDRRIERMTEELGKL